MVLGHVLTGMDVVTRISTAMCVNLKPSPAIVIQGAGALAEGSAAWAAVDKEVKARAAAAAAASAAAAGAPAQGAKDAAAGKAAAAAPPAKKAAVAKQ